MIVEQFIIPALLDHSRSLLLSDPAGLRAILNFAGEEAKHIHLFERFEQAFNRQFPVKCAMIGPSEAIGAEVLRRRPVAVGLTILMFEWMSQTHYVDSVKDAGDIDPLFKSMLKHHWIEEAQHAKLDTLLIDSLAADLDCSRPRGGDRRFSRYRRLLRRGPEGTGRPQSRRARRTDRPGGRGSRPRSRRSSTRPPAGPIWDRV